jgi:hypothetical protein
MLKTAALAILSSATLGKVTQIEHVMCITTQGTQGKYSLCSSQSLNILLFILVKKLFLFLMSYLHCRLAKKRSRQRHWPLFPRLPWTM